MKKKINGIAINFTEKGPKDGIPVIFIHGFPFDSTSWDLQLTAVAEKFRSIALDLRGYGESETGDGQYAIEFFVDDVFALMDELKLSKAILCGLSMGGYIALRAIEKASERVLGLVLCDTRSEADTNEGKLKRFNTLKTLKKEGIPAFADPLLKTIFADETIRLKPKIFEKIRSKILKLSPIAIGGGILALASRSDTTEYLENISVPTLIIVGEKDIITPPIVAQSMHEKISHSALAIIPHAGHLSNVENPEDFNRHLLDFLKQF